VLTDETRNIYRAALLKAHQMNDQRTHTDLTRMIVGQHPLLVAMDALLQVAQKYRQRYDANLAADWLSGPEWLESAKSLRRLLNFDFGPVHAATVEAVFWKACEVAGFEPAQVEAA
jgi:hypothetical protein